MNKLITIITVVYNDINKIESTIKSVLSQNRELIEYIVIDGNSNDGTKELISEYKRDIDIFVSEPDSGIYDAMNKGINIASGKYLHFLNSGDVFNNENVINSIFGSGKDIGSYDVVYGDTKVVFDNYFRITKGGEPNVINPMSFNHQSVFVKTDLMKSFSFNTKYKICADKNFFSEIYNLGANYYYTNSIISDITAIGYSNQNRVKNLRELKQIKREHNLPSNSINLKIAKACVVSGFERVFGSKFLDWMRYKIYRNI